ncbi:hypothetical protein RCZ15_22430 [Capnocytophaga catalasegens]|uniref:Uncharacterized protein n=2 Tax=Capnocytophaga catalasegens TaxID=1004260 RepID=A0AAV5AXY2_9FLAO|nr:hypothetical protein RCZ03_26280 [Capnocytophaga catalasegens]GJM51270.1 hypothetical protein RCZ15_22430 [Capnocytophaga catalasegens]GJM54003.1 hypothetical protein RCZ16_23190 [Capnocytophaga catalasegens]
MSLLFISCKIGQTTRHFEKHATEHTKTDTLIISKTEKIKDTLFIQVPVVQTTNKDCDTLCQKELHKILSQLRSRKNSGANKAGIYYDKLQKQIVLYNELQAQFDTYKSNNHKVIETKEVEINKEIPVPYIPKFIKFLAWCGEFSLLLIVVVIILFVLGKIIKFNRL